jgi:hypothetical protein
MPSKARMTCCCRPMTSSAGSWRSQTETDLADANGSVVSLLVVRNSNMGEVGAGPGGIRAPRERLPGDGRQTNLDL